MNHQLTGYPSIDRPQDKLYRTKPIREIETEQTIYEMIFNANKDDMLAPAIEYMRVTWTFERLKEKVDKVADAFVKAGFKVGDTILLGVSNCPEAVVTLLALNKIGVISRWFDIRASEKDIEVYVNDSNSRFIIVYDMLLPKIQSIINNTKLEKVLVVYPTDSLSLAMQVAYSIKANKLPKDTRFIRYKKFVKTGNSKNHVPCVAFDRNRPSVMIQSSGTTGKPKIIVHSDFSATSCSKKIAYLDHPIQPGMTILDALPPWIAYAIGQAIITPLSLGAKVRLCPTFDPDMVMKNLGHFNVSYAAPFHYRFIRDNFSKLSYENINGLKQVACFVSGGDKMTVEENAQIEKLLGTILVNGYGNNEGWGCLAVNPIRYNKYGTVGIPKYGETVIAYDGDSQCELPYMQSGEICILTDTMFLFYEGKPEETAAVKKLHPDGKVWLHTGDLGFIDEEGFITLNGRARRVIVRQGFKISAYTIEDKICEHPDVKECVAVEVKDEIEEHVPMAYVVLKSEELDKENSKKCIYEKCKNELKDYEVPKYIHIVSSLPYTPNNKYDFRLLEQQGNEYVDSLNN